MTKSIEFQEEAVHGLRCVKEEGYYYNEDGVLVETVRSLITLLGVSSSTLYRWDASIYTLDLEPDRFKPIEHTPEDEGFESYTPYVDEVEVDDFDDSENWTPEIKAIAEVDDEPHLLLAMMKDVGFWQSLARAMKIPNYRERTNQLKLKIGMALIRETGIVESEINHLRV